MDNFDKRLTPNQGRHLINQNFDSLDARVSDLEAQPSSLDFKGAWDASTNDKSLESNGDPNHLSGDYYKVNVTGSTDIDGITDWNVGDWIIYNGSNWEKIDQTELVTSVNGEVGDISLVTGVSSVNGELGDVSLVTGVSSVNGEVGDVSLDLGVSSLNGRTGDITLSIDDIPIPDEETINTSTETIAAGEVFNWTESISYNRLYGVRLEINGLTSSQTADVRMFGDAALTDEQYLASFTDSDNVDDAQAWRYRDRDKNNEFRLQVENTSGDSIDVSLTIRAEPF